MTQYTISSFYFLRKVLWLLYYVKDYFILYSRIYVVYLHCSPI